MWLVTIKEGNWDSGAANAPPPPPPPPNEYLYMYMCMYMYVNSYGTFVCACVCKPCMVIVQCTCTYMYIACLLMCAVHGHTGFSAGYGCSAQAAVGDTVVSVCGHQEPTEICKSTAAPPVYVHLNASVYPTRHT